MLALFISTTDTSGSGGLRAAPVAQSGVALARASNVVFDRARALVLVVGFGVTGNLITLCFQPVPEHLTRLIAAILFGDAMIVGATVPYALTVARLAPSLWAGWAAGDAHDADERTIALAALLQIATNAVVLVCRHVWLWRYRTDVQRLLPAQWRSLVLLFSGVALVHAVAFIGRALSGSLRETIAAEGDARGALVVFLVFAPIPAEVLFAAFAASPRLQRRAQALIAAPGSGVQGVVASLAPLVGYGSAEGARDVAELHALARAALRGVVLDAAGLDAVGKAWAAVDAARPYARPARARSRTSDSARGLHTAPRRSADSASKRPSALTSTPASMRRAVPALLRSASVEGRVTGAAARQEAAPPPANTPAQTAALMTERDEQLGALARTHTVAVRTYDGYVVHGEDEAHLKLAALRQFARDFEQAKGRPPVAFVSSLCDPPPACQPHAPTPAASGSRPVSEAAGRNGDTGGAVHAARLAAARTSRAFASSAQRADGEITAAGAAERSHAAALRSLEHLPVRLARSSRLLVLASPSLFERLWPTMEIFVWWLTGGGQDMVRVLPVVADERGRSALLAAVDAFHVMYCDEPRASDRRLVLRLVEIASTSAFNETVRALYPTVLDELARVAHAAELAAAAIDGAAGAADDQGRADRS